MSEYVLESEVRPETITFMAKKGGFQESYFDVWNRGEMHQIYKIKTSNVKGYKIKPPLFSIGVNERMRVFVTYLGFSDKPSKERISVVFAHHANVKATVQQAWDAVKAMYNTPEKRSYVTILFKEDQRRSIADVNDAQKSVVGKSTTLKAGSSRMDPSGSSGGRDDSYYAPPPTVPKPKGGTVRKRSSAKSNCSTEPSEETNEEPNNTREGKARKKTVSQTVEATEDDTPAPPPPPVKPRSRRKVQAPPPPAAEEEEEAAPAPPSPVRKPAIVRRIKSPARVAAEPAEDEMAEAPVAPKKTRKPVQQNEEEEEEAPPPPPKPAPAKPRSRRKVQATRPPANDEEEGAKKVASPVRARKAPSIPKQKPRRKSSGTMDPLESILGESKVVYIIQSGGEQNNDDEDEESDKKARNKSSKDGKKKKKRKEEDEDEE